MRKGQKFALAKSFMVGKELTDAEFRMLVTMWNYSDEEGRNIYGSRGRFAADCGWSTRTVDRHLKKLRDKGWIQVDRKGHSFGRGGGGFANVYSLHIPEPPKSTDSRNQSTNVEESLDNPGESLDNSGESLDNPDGMNRQSCVVPPDTQSNPSAAYPPPPDPSTTGNAQASDDYQGPLRQGGGCEAGSEQKNLQDSNDVATFKCWGCSKQFDCPPTGYTIQGQPVCANCPPF